MHKFVVDNRYKYQTRVGNWSEEWELNEFKKQNYLNTKLAQQQKAQNLGQTKSAEKINAQSVLDSLRYQIQSQGVSGIKKFSGIFKDLDINQGKYLDISKFIKQDHSLAYDDFKWGLRNFGVQLSLEESKALFDALDDSQKGTINIDEFLFVLKVMNVFPKSYLKAEPNDFRQQLIQLAYFQLKQKNNGKVTIEVLVRQVQIQCHPEVLTQSKSESQVFKEFVSNWDSSQPDKEISFSDFFGHFNLTLQDISASIEKDHDFETFIKQQWKL